MTPKFDELDDGQVGGMTQEEFCKAFGISERFYRKMKSEKWGPRLMALGGRTVISFAAIHDWVRDREQAYTEGTRRKRSA
jgi:hypothetical protein